jgi:hypothetical protein
VKIEKKEGLFLNQNVSDKTVFQLIAETDQEAAILKEMMVRMKREDGTLRILESGKTDLILWVPWAGYPR